MHVQKHLLKLHGFTKGKTVIEEAKWNKGQNDDWSWLQSSEEVTPRNSQPQKPT